METNYQQQAKDMLNEMGVKFTAKFATHGSHFVDDEQARDIFNLTLSRNGEKFSIRFGQSINESTGHGDNKPTPYDLLACITKSDPGTFEDFCYGFGYGTDSRKAEKIYKEVVKEWKKVSGFFTSYEIEKLQEIQ